ncbi:MAG: quinone oxidoreductase family protein [Pseudonocardia sp.]
MRAVQITAFGGPEILAPVELPDPRPGPGELLVDVAVAGVNYIDTYNRSGAYPVDLPFVLGQEGAGRVAALGPGDTGGFAVGDRVVWANIFGGYAQRVAVPADAAVAVPDVVPDDVAVGAFLQGMTAHFLVTDCAPAGAGDTVLVHAAAGGVGLLLTQLATARGARVLATVSTEAKADLAREAGAAEVLLTVPRRGPGDDLAARVRDLTGGEGVAVAFDGVGRDTFDASLASVRRRGTLVLFGAASGPVPPVDPQRLNRAGSVYLARPKLADYTATRAELTARAAAVFAAVADGTVAVRIGHRHPLADAAQAHRDLEGRRTTGKVLLVP